MQFLKATSLAGLMLVAAVSGFAQSTADLDQAKAALAAAEAAGAPAYAKTLYDDAAYRVRFAQENWGGKQRTAAQMRAIEAISEARAATAKARWLSTNAAIRTLQEDITRFGGTSSATLRDEPPNQPINRGATTKEHIEAAQNAIAAARAAGAETTVADHDLKTADSYLESARRVSRGNNNDTASHLAFRAEMMGRRAFYLARLAESTRALPEIQLQRTRLAQTVSERSAAAERAQREEAERRAADLQRQLAAEQANREAQTAEVERLRQQIDASRRAADERRIADRTARIEAERALDEAFRNYQTAITSASSTAADIQNARTALEDAQIALRAAQDRERLAQEGMEAEINRLRSDLDAARQANSMTAPVLSERQADLLSRQQQLDQFRRERDEALARRTEAERQQAAAITAAIDVRREREARAAQLQQQAEEARRQAMEAQQQATQATQAAQEATAAAQAATAELEKARKEAAERDAAAQAQAETQQKLIAEQQKAAAERETAARAELDRVREQAAQAEAEARRLRMENELARIAATRREERGFVVTLSSGVFFDTGKSALKKGAQATLTRIAEQLKTDDKIKVTVEGHTDSTGSEATNQRLSENRAQAVRDFLAGAGVPADRITSVGRGESQPVATNNTAAGRQQNRRVELVITQ
jgi:outer membrane protein OmpA-like peptidoglycan-associated protein